MEKNDILILDILNLGFNGEGVARHGGFAVFVPFALAGERVEAKIILLKKSFAIAKLIKVILKSPVRQEPLCPAFFKCGGCQLQHLNYEAQLDFKTRTLKDCLSRQGIKTQIDRCTASPNIYGYRNKLQLPVAADLMRGGVKTGFFREGSREIVDIESCPLHSQSCSLLIKIVKEYIAESGDTAYGGGIGGTGGNNIGEGAGDGVGGANGGVGNAGCASKACNGAVGDKRGAAKDSANGAGVGDGTGGTNSGNAAGNAVGTVGVGKDNAVGGNIRHIVYRELAGKILITVVVNSVGLKNERMLIDLLRANFKDFGLYINVNRQSGNVILGEEFRHIYGLKRLDADMSGIKFCVGARSFLQTNDAVARQIYQKTEQLIKQNDVETVIDAYSGIGIMTAVLSRLDCVKKAYVIEIVKEAYGDAQTVKSQNGISKLTNINGDAAQRLPKLLEKLKDGKSKTALILDPPRKGCDKRITDFLSKNPPALIVYISCNPATLARDIADINKDGRYSLTAASSYDMFPQTKHVEALVCLKANRLI
jgi:23S rRNA (uracil1939-C5)-methyltransferase